jgi:hypothetical protein
MSRLSAIEKGNFYPYPEDHLPALASLFTPDTHGGKLLDPCAGEGAALHYLSNAWGLHPYANELDTERAAACVRLFGATQAVQGDLYQLRASTTGFVALWCNPPYVWDKTGSDKRRELGMLKHSLKWLQSDGYALWCVYAHHVTTEAASYLAARCSQIDIWKLPGLHLGEYTHVVVVARLGQPTVDPDRRTLQLVELARGNGMPELTIQAMPRYEFPSPVSRKSFLFAPKVISPEIALQAVREGGAQFGSGFTTLLEPPAVSEEVRPVVRPRGRQLALILAAGMFNGLVLDADKGRAAVRSTVEPVEELIETEGDPEGGDEETAREVFQTRPRVTITLLSESGDVTDLSGDSALVDFIKAYKPVLMQYLDDHFKPLYSFDYSDLKPVLAYPKGGKLYPTQKHVIAACHTALMQRRGVILVGEPGTGKTIMGATVAVALQPQMQPGQVVIVMAPPHLVEKWEREVRQATRRVYTKILKNVDDTRAFMDRAAQNSRDMLNVGILSRETAKLGEGWEVQVNWRKTHIARWPLNATPESAEEERIVTLTKPVCPTCGATIEKDKDIPADLKWLERVPRYCPKCKAALWSKTRTFSKPKVGNRPTKNPRVPLAEYLATQFPGRIYLYIADEIHELKSCSTDQGEAMMVLANAATKTLGLTGTLYGGCASSLYNIEFVFNPRVRTRYPWGKVNQWVRDMGCLERIVEYKPQYDKSGVFSGKRRSEQKPKEAPGCSPVLVSEIIDHCVFVGLNDMGRVMPDFDEVPVPISPDGDLASLYADARQKLGYYLFQCRMEGDASALGMYLQTLLSWPSAPYREELCIHRKRLNKESDDFVEIPVHTIPALDENRLYAKERWLIDTVREELAQGRGVAVFCRQTGTRDIQPRLEKLLKQHIPLCKPFILKGSVQAYRREEVLNRQLELGVNTLICNPKLVQTGLDLVALPTIIFFEVDYSLYVMGQASRRAWRLIQDKPCKVFYPYYTELMENQAVELIGLKQQAAGLLYGEETGGLSTLKSAGGGSLLAELAAEMGADKTISDLGSLFARHAQQSDPTESAWFTEAPAEELSLPVETTLEQPAILQTQPDLIADPLLQFLTDMGGVIAEVQELRQPVSTLPAPLPPRKPVKRRRVKLTDAPEDEPALLHATTTPAPRVWKPLPAPQNATQLALF